jgi:hypothetical protein
MARWTKVKCFSVELNGLLQQCLICVARIQRTKSVRKIVKRHTTRGMARRTKIQCFSMELNGVVEQSLISAVLVQKLKRIREITQGYVAGGVTSFWSLPYSYRD